MIRPTAATLLILILGTTVALAGCGPGGTTTPAADTGIRGTATAGPTCPVVRNPPDPFCADRPVAGATIVIRDGSGAQIAAAVTAADGTYGVAVAPGEYLVDPLPVPGMLGTAAKQAASVKAGSMTEVDLSYDTGIR